MPFTHPHAPHADCDTESQRHCRSVFRYISSQFNCIFESFEIKNFIAVNESNHTPVPGNSNNNYNNHLRDSSSASGTAAASAILVY